MEVWWVEKIYGEGLREGAQLPPFRGLSSGVAGEAGSLPAFSGGLAFGGGLAEQLAQWLHVELTAPIDPLRGGLDGDDAHEVGGAFKLLDEALEQIGRLAVLVVRERQPLIREGRLEVGLDPRAALHMLVLLTRESALRVRAGLGRVPAVVEPAQFLQAGPGQKPPHEALQRGVELHGDRGDRAGTEAVAAELLGDRARLADRVPRTSFSVKQSSNAFSLRCSRANTSVRNRPREPAAPAAQACPRASSACCQGDPLRCPRCARSGRRTSASSISASSASCTIVCTNARSTSSSCESARNCCRGITVVFRSWVGRPVGVSSWVVWAWAPNQPLGSVLVLNFPDTGLVPDAQCRSFDSVPGVEVSAMPEVRADAAATCQRFSSANFETVLRRTLFCRMSSATRGSPSAAVPSRRAGATAALLSSALATRRVSCTTRRVERVISSFRRAFSLRSLAILGSLEASCSRGISLVLMATCRMSAGGVAGAELRNEDSTSPKGFPVALRVVSPKGARSKRRLLGNDDLAGMEAAGATSIGFAIGDGARLVNSRDVNGRGEVAGEPAVGVFAPWPGDAAEAA